MRTPAIRASLAFFVSASLTSRCPSGVRMAVFMRARFPGPRGKLAWALASHSPQAEASLGRLLVKGSPRLLHTTAPARTTSHPAHEHRAADGAKVADAAEATAGRLQEELFRVLCQPRPSSPSLVALVRGIVAAGAAPSLAAVQALADHLTAAKDARSLKVRSRRCTQLTFSGWHWGALLCYLHTGSARRLLAASAPCTTEILAVAM